MLNPDLLTALHYCAVITLTGAITSEYFLFRRGMSIDQVRKLLLADSLAALALLLIFITGLLLVLAHPQPPPPCSPTRATAPSCCCSSSWPSASATPSRLFHRWRRSPRQGVPHRLHPAAALGDLDPQGQPAAARPAAPARQAGQSLTPVSVQMTGDKAPAHGYRTERGPRATVTLSQG